MILSLITISSVNAVDLTLSPDDSINDAINNVNANGTTTSNNTITLNKGTYKKPTDINNHISINNINLTIKGNGPKGSVIFDPQNSGRIFYITGNSNVTFINIIFINGNANRGGGIYNQEGKLTFIDCDFKDNTASEHGGAIYNQGEKLTIINSNFNGNTAGSSGGAIFNTGKYLNITNSKFSNNNAIKESGGAIHTIGERPSIINSSFKKNTAKMYGGAVAMPMSSSNYATISACRFEDNTALSYEGGGIYSIGNDYVKVTNSTFINNSGSNTGGGGIHTTGGNYFYILNCTFINNTAKGGSAKGGGVNIAFGNLQGHPKGDYASIINCTFIDNRAERYGGAIMVDYGNNCTISKSNFINNTANVGGSAILVGMGHNFSLKNSNFTENYGTSVIYIYGNNAVIEGSNIYSNSHGILIAYGSDIKVNYNRIFNNTESTGYNLENSGSNTNLDFNWWGDDKPKVKGTLNNYFVMNIVNLTNLYSNGKVSFYYTFKLNTGEYVNKSLLPYFVFNVYSDVTNNIIDSFDAREDRIFDVKLNTVGEVIYMFGTDNEVQALEGEVVISLPPITDPTPDKPITGPTEENKTKTPEKEKPKKIPEQKSEDENERSNNIVTVNSAMKSTGIPINLILLILLSVFGVLVRKKSNLKNF